MKTNKNNNNLIINTLKTNFIKIPLLLFFIFFSSCKQTETVPELKEVNFDLKEFISFRNDVLKDLKFDSFEQYSQQIINYSKANSYRITESDIAQAEYFLDLLGFFDEPIDLNYAQDTYFDFLLMNGVISTQTYNFVNTTIPDYYSIDITIVDDINYYMNNNTLSNTEIVVLDQLLLLTDNSRNWACNIGCSVWGGLWGLGGSVFTPAVGVVVGIYASVTCGAACEYYYEQEN